MIYKLEFRLQILYFDTCHTAQALVRLMIDLIAKNLEVIDRDRDTQEPRFCDVVDVFKLLTKPLPEAAQLLTVNNSDTRQISVLNQYHFQRTNDVARDSV